MYNQLIEYNKNKNEDQWFTESSLSPQDKNDSILINFSNIDIESLMELKKKQSLLTDT